MKSESTAIPKIQSLYNRFKVFPQTQAIQLADHDRYQKILLQES